MTQNPPQVRKVGVGVNEDGQRIDNFLLRQLPGVPKSHIYRLLRSGQVRVNGGRVKPERKLVRGDEVRVPPVRVSEDAELRVPDALVQRLRAQVVHEDGHYLAIDKPAGVAAHAGSGIDFGVIEALRASGRYPYLELAHRLDRDTSGVLLLAKSRPALLRAQRMFKEGGAQKRYFALLDGRWKGEDRDVDDALAKNALAGGERRVRVDEVEGKAALSRFTPQSRFKDATLCEVQIFSGRTHQIRVHAAAIGHPVAGDGKYGERETNRRFREQGLKRMFLHSHLLSLPAQGEFGKLIVSAPLPDELREFLETLPGARPAPAAAAPRKRPQVKSAGRTADSAPVSRRPARSRDDARASTAAPRARKRPTSGIGKPPRAR